MALRNVSLAFVGLHQPISAVVLLLLSNANYYMWLLLLLLLLSRS
jgi:hypothetical protein